MRAWEAADVFDLLVFDLPCPELAPDFPSTFGGGSLGATFTTVFPDCVVFARPPMLLLRSVSFFIFMSCRKAIANKCMVHTRKTTFPDTKTIDTTMRAPGVTMSSPRK